MSERLSAFVHRLKGLLKEGLEGRVTNAIRIRGLFSCEKISVLKLLYQIFVEIYIHTLLYTT